SGAQHRERGPHQNAHLNASYRSNSMAPGFRGQARDEDGVRPRAESTQQVENNNCGERRQAHSKRPKRSSRPNRVAVSTALGVPAGVYAPASNRASITASSFLKIPPANGDWLRSLSRFTSAPALAKAVTRSGCPLYAASMTNDWPSWLTISTRTPWLMYSIRVVSPW